MRRAHRYRTSRGKGYGAHSGTFSSAARSSRAAASLALGLTIAGCATASTPAGRVPVVAAENFYGNVAAQVGARHVYVTSIVKDPSADPHEYTGRTQDTEAVAHARVVVVNGLGYDSFMDRLLAAAPASGRTVLRVSKLAGAHGNDPNPHLWYDPATAARVATALGSAFSKADPAHTPDYRSGAARFVASLRPLNAEVATLHRRFAGRPYAYTERVPEYLMARIGLRPLTPREFAKANEAGIDLPPRAVAAMRALVTKHRIRLLVYNAQAGSSAGASVRDLARRNGIPVVGVTETEPPHTTFQRWQLDQLQAIAAALGRGA